MRSVLIIISLLTGACGVTFAQGAKAAFPALIPLPVAASYNTDSFFITTHTIVKADAGCEPLAALLKGYVAQEGGITLEGEGRNRIVLHTDSAIVTQQEGYRLHISREEVSITAHDAAGIVHGIETLRQLWHRTNGPALALPGAVVNDYPRFAYRGMHLDVSRHFFSVDFIKQFIDQLALYKINNFHWHLTDDQGWRIEIKKYPRLQSVAAWRDQTMIGHKKELPHRFDGKRYGGYYTQEQVKEVVAYAAARHINVIPEIEMPGHALAALAAYPALGCTKGPYKTAQFWGIFDDVFCAGNDSTFLFLQDVLDEVMALFPSSYIHIGGDECPKVRWANCPLCRQRMKEEHLADEAALQSYFIRRISNYIHSKGRKLVGWDEILEGGLAPGATVMSWRGVEGAIAAAKQQHHVIMTPEDKLYFDYYQSLYPEEPTAAGGYTPLEDVYAYDPLHAAGDTALLPYIAGMQGQLWSEYFDTEAQVQYMAYPRMLAFAERAWSPQATRDYPAFLQRVKAQQPLLEMLHIHAAATAEEITYKTDSIAKGKLFISLHTAAAAGEIRYTTDGSAPGVNSPVYSAPLEISQSCTLKAALYQHNSQVYRTFRQSFFINKATGAAVTLKQPPNTKYAGGNSLLVNGIAGSNRYNDQQWLGFSNRDLDGVIDLGSEQVIRQVGAGFLNYHWQKMWPPVSLEFEVSADGIHFKPLTGTNAFPVNGINNIRLKIPPVKARFIRVLARSHGVIPVGEYGAGGNSMLLVDEIIIN